MAMAAKAAVCEKAKASLKPETKAACEACIKACNQDEPNVLSETRELFTALEAGGDKWDQVIGCHMVGITPHNRSQSGVDSNRCSELFDNVATTGWDSKEVRQILHTVESEDTAEVNKFNRDEVAKSNHRLAPVEESTIRYVNLWGNHMNQTCRMVWYKMGHSNSALTTDGRIDLNKLQRRSPKFYEAVVNGFSRSVINGKVFQAYPELYDIVIEAGHAAGQLGSTKSDFQVLRELHAGYERFKQQSGTCDFAKVKASVLKTRVDHVDALPEMYSFVLNHSGGANKHFLLDAEADIKRLGYKLGTFPVEKWTSLTISMRGLKQCSQVRWCAVRLMHELPKNVSQGDLKKMFSKDNVPFVHAADEMLRSFTAMAHIQGCSNKDRLSFVPCYFGICNIGKGTQFMQGLH